MSSAEGVQWCFVLPDELRRYEHVLGLGVSPEDLGQIACSFTIPTADFGINGVLVFSEQSRVYSAYRISEEQLEEHLLTMVRGVLTPPSL
jgi:hypothetical protein